MNEEEQAIKLGFLNAEEMQLYYDVCGDITAFSSNSQELDTYPENYGHRRIDYDNYMKEKELQELFDKVKVMTPLNRMIEIYVYYANYWLLAKEFISLYKKKLKKAQNYDDGEGMIEASEMLGKLVIFSLTCMQNMIRIRDTIKKRIPSQKSDFDKAVACVEQAMDERIR